MTDKGKGKAGKAEYTEANVTAQTMTKDPGVKAQHGSGGAKVVPHNRDRALLPHQSARRNLHAPGAVNQPSTQNSLTSLKPGLNVRHAIFLWE